MTILGAMSGDNTDWKAMFTGLIDRTIAGDIVIPNTLSGTSIAPYIFQNCAGVTSITLPPQVTEIGQNAFEKCSNVERIVKSDGSGITVVNGRSFGDCSKLVEIPPLAEGMTTISTWAFMSTSLTSVDLPSSIVQINNQAFFACSKLSYIIVRATTPPTLQNTNAIPKTIGSIYVPDASVSAYQAANNWSTFADKIKPLSELTT